MFKQFVILCVVALSVLGVVSGETSLRVDYFKAGSNCQKPTSPPTTSVTYELNKCYKGKMYDCDSYDKSVTYMIYSDVNCAAKYPSTYGLPASMCLTSVYGYSSDDTFFTCT